MICNKKSPGAHPTVGVWLSAEDFNSIVIYLGHTEKRLIPSVVLCSNVNKRKIAYTLNTQCSVKIACALHTALLLKLFNV